MKQVSRAEKNANNQLEKIFNYSMDMIGLGNLQGYFTKINPSFEHVLGYPEKMLLENPFIQFVHEEDIDKTKKALDAAINGQKEIYIENRYRCSDGSYKWIDWKVQAMSEENQFVAVGRDISHKKALEIALRRSEKLYRNIIQTTSDGFLVVNKDGLIEECNTSYVKMSGFTKDELLTFKIHDLDAIEKNQETTEHIESLIESGWGSFETKHRRKDGSTFDVEIRTSFLKPENNFVSFVRDITQHNQFIKSLEENEERFRQLAENISEVFWLGSVDWQEIYYISPAYEKIWGKTCKELYDKPLSWLDSIHEEDRENVAAAIPDNIDKSAGSIIFPEYRIFNLNGKIRWILAQAFPVRNAKGKIYRIAGIAQDITERKQAELEKQKLVTKLEKALVEVKTLQGFLPICSSCKKIRNDQGYWKQIETYIMEHSKAQFTHSICPGCAKKLYPTLVDDDGNLLI